MTEERLAEIRERNAARHRMAGHQFMASDYMQALAHVDDLLAHVDELRAAVVTEEMVERAARRIASITYGMPWGGLRQNERDQVFMLARRALTAALAAPCAPVVL